MEKQDEMPSKVSHDNVSRMQIRAEQKCFRTLSSKP